MLRSILLGYCLFLNLAVSAQQDLQKPALIPIPAEVQWKEGFFKLSDSISISVPANQPAATMVASQLAAKLKAASGIPVDIISGNSATIRFQINKHQEPALGKEGYQLSVTQNGIQISANDAAGLFYAVQTLYQLLPPEIESKTRAEQVNWILPFAEITDRPRFAWRGLMLDVARHFFTKQQVKDFIDNMVRYKYNMLHLHLTDDQGWRIEIKSLPRLTEVGAYRAERTGRWGEFQPQQPGEPSNYGGYYTQEDIRELVAYAKERYVNILPEIDVPGHSLAMVAAYPELSCTPGTYQVSVGNRFMIWPGNGTFYGTLDNNLCPANELVYQYLDKIFAEIAALFPFEYIHMGGDETYKGFWEKSEAVAQLMKKEHLKDMHEVQSYFVKRVAKIISAKGKKLMGWDEIMEGGLAPGSAVMSWRGEKGGIEAAKLKHKVVMSPSTYTYVDLYQGDPLAEPPTYSMLRLSKSYAFNPVPQGVDSNYVLGGQANLWSERLHTVRHAEYMLWPRGWAVAESVWSPVARKNWDDFVKRAESHFVRSDIAGVNYSRSLYDPIIEVKKITDSTIQVGLRTEVSDVEIHYSFDEFYPDAYYPIYQQPLLFPPGASSLKVQTFRNRKPMGKPINLPLADLLKRAK